MKKFAGIAFVMAAVMLTVCQNNVVNSDITAESTENTSGITQTSDTEQSGTESLTEGERQRNELFERAKTIQQDDTTFQMLEKLGDGYVDIGSGISCYCYFIDNREHSEYFEVYLGTLSYCNKKAEEIELNGKVDVYSADISEKFNKLTERSTLDDVERILGEPDGKYTTDALKPSTVNAYEYAFGDGDRNDVIYFTYDGKLRAYKEYGEILVKSTKLVGGGIGPII